MRSYTKLYVSLTHDDDFRKLDVYAQWLYLRILADPALNRVGVAPHRPVNYRSWASQTSPRYIGTAVQRLVNDKFIVVDRALSELWVRSWMRYDDTFRNPNLMKAAAVDFQLVASPAIRAAVLDVVPSAFREGFSKGFPKGVPKGVADNNNNNQATKQLPTTNPLNTHTQQPKSGSRNKQVAAAPPSVCVSEGGGVEVKRLWERWPEAKRGDLGRAAAAWALAIDDEETATLVNERATKWLHYWVAEGIAERYVPRLTKWLAERSWETAPPASAPNKAETRRRQARDELQAFIERGEA